MPENTWVLTDGIPDHAQTFAPVPPEWDATHWGAPLLAFNAADTGGPPAGVTPLRTMVGMGV